MKWQFILAAILLMIPFGYGSAQEEIGPESQVMTSEFAETPAAEANVTASAETIPAPRSRDQLLIYVFTTVVLLGTLAARVRRPSKKVVCQNNEN